MNVSQISATSRLFSSAVFKELAVKGWSALFARLLDQSGLTPALSSTVGEVFEKAFATLRTVGMRDEYVFKAALTHKVLLGTHSLKTASMLTEFRAGNCKADMVILNGTATVYEIKSERDSLSRLERQLAAYRKVFTKAYVIAAEDHVEGVKRCAPEEVGILCLTRRFQIRTVRPAIEDPSQICPETLFDSLRAGEAEQVLTRLGADLPQVPNTQLYAAQKALFRQFDAATLHFEAVRVLKSSRNLAPLASLVNDLPPSLHAAALTISIRQRDHATLVEAVNTPVGRALEWA
ncbi:sce7726 family protein [Sphingomonas sp. H39-1-10]|uniref:sce7726 family protein n=1 Tax=Sphingomonas pollutisoli TaxID=3030829 RepID=UPI0023B95A95|nr:sce7726 family protein [Sphingomonas pollutisoli]MDF0490709.1 sce7726 family protein [Sphingomonas pollutisoli]